MAGRHLEREDALLVAGSGQHGGALNGCYKSPYLMVWYSLSSLYYGMVQVVIPNIMAWYRLQCGSLSSFPLSGEH